MRTYQPTISAKAGDGYNVNVVFSDGTHGVFDFEPFLQYPCYASLQNKESFDMVRAEHGTLVWPGDIDIAPERVWIDTART